MKLADGRVDVIIDGVFLVDIDEAGQAGWTAASQPRLSRSALKQLWRNTIHEAQHVVMAQRDSVFKAYDSEAHAGDFPRRDYAVAVKVCDEHRAEWSAIQRTSPALPTPGDIVDILSHLGAELAAADARYQSSPRTPQDVHRLREDVYNACAALWTSMAYWTAQFRLMTAFEMSGRRSPIAVWQRYVGGTRAASGKR